MNKIKLQEIKYASDKNELTYQFNRHNIYTILSKSNSNDDSVNPLFQIMAKLKIAKRGIYFWDDIDTNKLDGSTFRSNMITIIDEDNEMISDMKVLKYLKYVTDDFRKLYFDNIEFVDYLELIYDLLKGFGFDKDKMKLKIKDITTEERWNLKIVESLLKGSELLLIDKTLDTYDEQLQFQCFDKLRKITQEYNQCVILFTQETNLFLQSDYQITI